MPLLIVAGCLLGASQARANQIPGATYAGTHVGNGTIRFTVATDGTALSSYRIDDIPGDTCVFVAQGDAGIWPGTPIVNAGFSYQLADALSLDGTFQAPQSASGTFRLHNAAVAGVKPACSSGTIAWTATTTATPPATGPPPASPRPGTTPSAPNATGPRPPARTYRTTVLLRVRGTTRLTGRIKSRGAGCARGRTVTLMRDSRRLKAVSSNVGGYFKFKRTKAMRGRRIRVMVSQRRSPSLVCAAGASRTVRLPRR